MLFQTTSAHEELRAKIRSFAEEEIKPLAFLMDQNNEFPDEAVKKLGKLGWMGIPYPRPPTGRRRRPRARRAWPSAPSRTCETPPRRSPSRR